MAITYFVDPTNGVNTNDGLSPGTALADFFTGVGGPEDVPVFWIKRGESITIATSKTIDYGDIYAWPKSTDDNYGTRPQAGIDAGWDNDTLSDPRVETSSSDISNIVLGDIDLGRLNFKGIFFSLNATAGGALFELKSPRIIFDNCTLSGDSHDMDILRYRVGISTKDLDNGVVEFNDCLIENKDWDKTGSNVYYLFANDDCNYKKELYLNNTTVLGIGTTVYSVRNGHGRYIRIFVSDSTIKNSHSLARTSTYRRSAHQDVHFEINNSSIQAESSVFELSSGTDYCLAAFHLEVNNSSFVSGEYIINDYHTSTSASYFTTLNKIVLRGSSFKGKNFYRNYAYCKTRIEHLDIQDCSFKDMSHVFYFHGLGQVDSFNFVSNQLEEVEGLIYCNTPNAAKCNFNISLKGQSMTSYLVNRCAGGEIYLEDCNIGKELAGNECENMNIVAINSNFDAIKGVGHSVSLSSCRLESSDGPALEGITGEISDSQILSTYANILTPLSSVIFDGCNLEVKGITPPIGGRSAKLIKTVYNGNPEPMLIVSDRATKRISPIYRVNGNPFSLLVQSVPKAYNSRTIISSIYTKHLSNKPLVTAYMTSVDDITDLERVSMKASFVSEGILRVVDMPIVIDNSSQWDGVQIENKKYKAQVNLSSFTILDGSKIKAVISLSHKSGKTSSINIDTLLGQE